MELSADLIELTEQMAARVHEMWMQARLAEGWVYGPKRNDDLKTHPCLVPYADLPDSEKQYDRTTAIETLKLIVSLGYKITKL